MSVRFDRKELRQPDTFQTTVVRAGEKLAPHRRKFAFAGIAVVAIVAVAWGVGYQRHNDLLQLSADYAQATKAYDAAKNAALTGEKPDWSGVETSLRDLYARSGGTDLHPFVLFYLFNTFLESGRADAAIDVAQELRAAAGDRQDLLAAAFYATAKAYEVRGDMRTAQAFYDQAANVDGNPFGEFVQSEAEAAKRPAVPPIVRARYLPPVTDTLTDGKLRQPISIPLKR